MRVAGPRDELPSFALPLSWRAILWRALVRGAACGLLLAVALVPVGVFLELRNATVRPWTIVAFALFAGVVGLVGTAPAAAVELWARARPGRTTLAALASGALVSSAVLLVMAQALYLSGALRGGPEVGMDRVSRMFSAAASHPNKVVGGTLGFLLALGLPFGLTVALRLRGFRLIAQAALGGVVSGGAAVALVVGAGIVTAIAQGDFERAVAVPVVGALVALGGFAGFGLFFVGAPLATLIPFVLALADAIGERVAPTPAAPPESEP